MKLVGPHADKENMGRQDKNEEEKTKIKGVVENIAEDSGRVNPSSSGINLCSTDIYLF